MVGTDLPTLWAETFSLPLMAGGALALAGWLLGGRRWVGGAALWGALALVVLGALAGLAIYVLNGVSVGNALRGDPLGGLVWFGLVGLQLAVPALGLFGLRLAMSGKETR